MSALDRIFGPRLPDDWQLHECTEDYPDTEGEDYAYGEAITAIGRSPKGTWWAWAGSEYASPIRYCPFCGAKLP